MSEPTIEMLKLEVTAKGKRKWLTKVRRKRILAVLADLADLAPHAEDGALRLRIEGAGCELTHVAVLYGLIPPEEQSSDDAPPLTDDEIITEELKESSPGASDD